MIPQSAIGGVIVGAYTSESGGWTPVTAEGTYPASRIRYDVRATPPDGRETIFLKVGPTNEQWPDVVNVRPVRKGKTIIGVVIGHEVRWHIEHIPDFGDCPSQVVTP